MLSHRLISRMLLTIVTLGCGTSFAAEVVKKTAKKAVIKVSADEAEDFEEGDTIILKSPDKKRFKLNVEQIDGRLLTVTGPIEGLDPDDIYRVAGSTGSSQNISVGSTTSRMDVGNTLPFYANISLGRRWLKDVETQNLVDFRIGYIWSEIPLGVSGYITSYTPILNDDFISENDLSGSEFGVQAELTRHFGPFRPYLGVRFLLAGTLSGDLETSDPSFTSTSTISEKREKTAAIELGSEYYFTKSFALSMTFKKSSSAKGDRKSTFIVTDSSTGDRINGRDESKYSVTYDEFLFGMTFFGLNN
ncbi:MAG: hypothetical protein EOP07_03365 [Proteobacteria bacterium]|nr:MAG: hypothetical protein EOP07_03365 [Pseudomonadota bacterium]